MRRETAQPRQPFSHGLRYFALAATVLIFAGSIYLLAPPGNAPRNAEEAGAMRGGTAAQVVRSASPAQDAQQLESELTRLGVQVKRRGTAEKIELRIALACPVKDAVRAALEQRAIPLPEQGELVVVYVAGTP